MLNQYPEDFDLYRLGIWDDKGKFSDIEAQFMVSLISLKEQTEIDQKNGNPNPPGESVQPLQPASANSSQNSR